MFTPQDFGYHLPNTFIAQHPISPRDAAKLLVVNRKTQAIAHAVFKDVLSLLTSNDVIVLNDSKVFPARLIGKKQSGGHAEVLLLRPLGNNRWEAMSNGLKPTQIVHFGDELVGHVVDKNHETGDIMIQLEPSSQSKSQDIDTLIHAVGKTPLPHYIHTPLSEQTLRTEYQTVYANESGSAAAPTAGMHFTHELLQALSEKGIGIERVTLHVGPGTFAKLRPEQIESKTLHTEWYEIQPEVADRLNQAKQAGKRIIAVGTTACRTLESACDPHTHRLTSQSTSTSIFIMPGYQFTFVDGLITNFHLPESSLLMLVSALCSQPNTTVPFTNFHNSLMGKAYEAAKANHYRFFSFGDAMLIL